MSSASAVSRSLSPVKYRSSTTRLARGSIFSSRESASSSATRSSSRSSAAGSTSLSDIRTYPRALSGVPGAGVVHENMAHVTCDGGEEVSAALPAHLFGPEQPRQLVKAVESGLGIRPLETEPAAAPVRSAGWVRKPRWVRMILAITVGSSMVAMIFKPPP